MLHVAYFATLRELTGRKEETLAKCPPTVLALVTELATAYGKEFHNFCLTKDAESGKYKVSRNLNILVGGRHIHHLQEGDTPLKDGDEVAVFPLIGGG